MNIVFFFPFLYPNFQDSTGDFNNDLRGKFSGIKVPITPEIGLILLNCRHQELSNNISVGPVE